MNNLVVIAVSGLPGAGTSTVSRELARRLGLDYFSPGQFFKNYSETRTQTDKAIDVWKNKGKEKSFHQYLDNLQLEKAKKGNIVICGKLSIYVLKEISNLKVWVDCSLKERVRRSMKRDRISFEEAEKKLAEREKIEDKEWKRIYGVVRREQRKMADLIINGTDLTPEQIVKRILNELV